MVSPLDRKLLRDLWRLKGQATAIAMIIALGVLSLVMMHGTVDTLSHAQKQYYDHYRLADIFAPAKRAPDHLLGALGVIPGVKTIEGRINGQALIDIPAFPAPVRTQLVSLPDHRAPRLNAVRITDGRAIDPARVDEILLLRAFADAHGLRPGATLTTNLNGARHRFTIAGLAESPEFLYALAPGSVAPDESRYAVVWMGHGALAAAYDLDGAFNEVLVGLTSDASAEAVRAALDRRLDRFGGTGAYDRAEHVSDRFITEEIAGMASSAQRIPPLFLAIAAFLLYIVIARMIDIEREQIGLLKAFGYGNGAVIFHYGKFIIIVALGGAVVGCGLGVWAGHGMAGLYADFFKFPDLSFQADTRVALAGVVVSLVSALAGGGMVLRRVFALTPAVAMRPPAPADYSKAAPMGALLKRVLDQPSRMIIRRLLRQPIRALATITGISAGMALTVGMLNVDAAFKYSLVLGFSVIDRGDATVSFLEPRGRQAIHSLRRVPGIQAVEPFRGVPVVFHNGRHHYRGSISGMIEAPRLVRAMDQQMQPLFAREDGLILAKPLAEILAVTPGDVLTIEVREGARPTLHLPVVALAESLFGAPAYMGFDALNRVLDTPGQSSGAHLMIDSSAETAVLEALKDMPAVAGVSLTRDTRTAFQVLMDTGAGAKRFIMIAVAAIMSFGIVYNSARIAYSERLRDLASLRVIGFTKGEAGFVLLGELGLLVVVALPIGGGLGYALGDAIAAGFSTDLYQIPAIIAPEAFSVSAIAVTVAAMGSGLLLKRDIDRLDLVTALKTRD